MKQVYFTIAENKRIAKNVCRMRLLGDTSAIAAPGQFVNIKLDGFFLRRPISVCDAEDGELTLIYKTVGAGTEKMSALAPGEKLDLLTGLGNGYDTSKSGEAPLLLGGGVGAPPMYLLAKKLLGEGVLGFNTADEVFLAQDLRSIGCEVTVATADGSLGVRGFVTDALPDDYTYFYACGPEPMLRAVCFATATSGQLSFEERMGCGFGACMGCTCETLTGCKRICRDGPVLEKEEIIWRT